MALLETAYSDMNLSNSKPPQIFQQSLPQFKVNYPFWNENMRMMLMLKQQADGGDIYKRYSIDTQGLKDSKTHEIHPFYILCNHQSHKVTKNGSQVCAYCGWFCGKTQPDQTILERTCTHPIEYSIIKKNRMQKQCGQCGLVVSIV